MRHRAVVGWVTVAALVGCAGGDSQSAARRRAPSSGSDGTGAGGRVGARATPRDSSIPLDGSPGSDSRDGDGNVPGRADDGGSGGNRAYDRSDAGSAGGASMEASGSGDGARSDSGGADRNAIDAGALDASVPSVEASVPEAGSRGDASDDASAVEDAALDVALSDGAAPSDGSAGRDSGCIDAGCAYPSFGLKELSDSAIPYLRAAFFELGHTLRALGTALDSISTRVAAGNTPSSCGSASVLADGSIAVEDCLGISAGTLKRDGSTYRVDVYYPRRKPSSGGTPLAGTQLHIVGELAMRTEREEFTFDSPSSSTTREAYAPNPTSELRVSDASGSLPVVLTEFLFSEKETYSLGVRQRTWEGLELAAVLSYREETSCRNLTVDSEFRGATSNYGEVQATSSFHASDETTTVSSTSSDLLGGATLTATDACSGACTEGDTRAVTCGDGGTYTQECLYGYWRSTTMCTL